MYATYGMMEKKFYYSSKALEILRRANVDPMSYELGAAHVFHGSSCHYIGDFEQARINFEEAIRIGHGIENCENCHNILASSYTNLGTLYRYMGNLDKAIECVSKGVEIFEANHDEYDLGLVPQYFSIGYIYFA